MRIRNRMKSIYEERWKTESFSDAKRMIFSSDNTVPSDKIFENAGLNDANFISQFVNHESKVLDFGCGVGRVARFLSNNVHTLYGVDISTDMLNYARKYCQDCSNTVFEKTNGREIPLKDNFVDFAYSLLVLQHLEKEDAFYILKEIHRILKFNGKAYLTFPNLTSAVYWKDFETFANKPSLRNIARPRFYTSSEVEFLIKKAGFQIIQNTSSNTSDANIKVVVEKHED